MEKSFERFLLENNLINRFLFNIRKFSFNPNWGIRNIPKDDYIKLSFKWGDTPQGKDYWQDIDKKWLNKIYS